MNRVIPRLAALIFTSLFSLSASAEAFTWCRPLKDFTADNLKASKVPERPADLKFHRVEDGNWLFNRPIEEIWEIYTQNPLSLAWKSKLIQYAYAVDPHTKLAVNESDKALWPGLIQGLRFYLDILAEPSKSLCRMGMGVEVTEVKPLESIRYEYLDFSPAYGTQWIFFEKLGPETTRVRHVTEYRGKNFVLDQSYMHFHGEAIPSFHNSVKNLVRDGAVGPSKLRLRAVIGKSLE